ncbi:MAG TPA: crossover junction endodeoxyribonuclease RuvC [Nitrospinota bacterium]|nr:crossover junction endodeoxyribonuclease RuvC [Nitrospinota bacterium]
MKIIGVDPGTNVTGYGIVKEVAGVTKCITYNTIKAGRGEGMAKRLHSIARKLRAVISEHRPDVLALEDSFYSKNHKSAIKLGMARGVVMQVAEEAGLEVFEYTPLLVKKSISGYGHADKEQVKFMVSSILGLGDELKSLDASDALAIAITHLNHSQFLRRTKK